MLNVPSALAVTELKGILPEVYRLIVTGLEAMTCPFKLPLDNAVGVGDMFGVSVITGVGDSSGVAVNVGVADRSGVDVNVGISVGTDASHIYVEAIWSKTAVSAA